MLPAPLICVIDDDPALRASVASLLESNGYASAQFRTADHFLVSEVRKACRCVVTDIDMPGTSGIKLKDILVAQGLNTPVIVITALSDDHWRARAVDTGSRFLSKPFSAEQLFKLINESLAE